MTMRMVSHLVYSLHWIRKIHHLILVLYGLRIKHYNMNVVIRTDWEYCICPGHGGFKD